MGIFRKCKKNLFSRIKNLFIHIIDIRSISRNSITIFSSILILTISLMPKGFSEKADIEGMNYITGVRDILFYKRERIFHLRKRISNSWYYGFPNLSNKKMQNSRYDMYNNCLLLYF